MSETMQVTVLGRDLGTASGWDGDPSETIWFYDFEPAEGVELNACKSLYIDYFNGQIFYDTNSETGSVTDPKDLAEFCAKLPRI